MASKELILHISTNKVGSEMEVGLGYTKGEWNDLTHKEQDDVVTESVFSYCDTWITGDE